MKRRTFLVGFGTLFYYGSAGTSTSAVATLSQRVSELSAEIQIRRENGRTVTIDWIAQIAGSDLSETHKRIVAFELVRNVPYKLTAWNGNPDALFDLGRGDCRHKSKALIRLLRAWKLEARPVQVPFDWADLPIPETVLQPLSETRGIHDSVDVKINGKWTLVDATWDPALGAVGFPVNPAWNGLSETLPITPKATTIIRSGDLKAGENPYSRFKINWPKRSEILAFNRLFNRWSDDVRSNASTEGRRP